MAEGEKSYCTVPSRNGYFPIRVSTKRLLPPPLGPTIAMCSFAPIVAVMGLAKRTSGLRATPRHAECILVHILLFCFIIARKGNNFIIKDAKLQTYSYSFRRRNIFIYLLNP